ncbi:3082_t:CDS:1 [Paraglomus brasilianum]|uniref:3082_t:CDS:1 n=1 Tax=Paraglomus brasilianum TaxID=144538 RepID=A0A9N9H7M1_9GLOM|nr:3082_t:CDS:1 [Paraglomus brasilianum]
MPQLAALHGMVFEEMAHNMLARGGTFDCRELTDDNNQTYYRSRLIADRLNIQYYHLSNIGDEQHYWRPSSENAGSIDAIYDAEWLFQMTVPVIVNHGIKGKPLDDVIKHLDKL